MLFDRASLFNGSIACSVNIGSIHMGFLPTMPGSRHFIVRNRVEIRKIAIVHTFLFSRCLIAVREYLLFAYFWANG